MKAVLRISLVAVTAASLAACVSSGSDKGNDSTADSSTSTSDSSSTTATTSTTGSGGASSTDTSSSTTGSGGSGGCVVMTSPLIADFEGYDGSTALDMWNWSFNDDGLGFGGFWLHSDEIDDTGTQAADGEYTLNFIAGYMSTYAANGQDPNADSWGGGIAMYTSCLDATAYTGIQFMIQGSDPRSTFDMSITVEGDQSFASGDLDLPADWAQVQVAFADMAPSDDNDASATSTNGNGIIAIVFSSHLNWVPDPNATDGSYIAEPGAFQLTVDDISFY